MAQLPTRVLSITGASITTSYTTDGTQDATVQIGRGQRVVIQMDSTFAAGPTAGLTDYKIQCQTRYNDGTYTAAWEDVLTTRIDTLTSPEVLEHTVAVSAGNTVPLIIYTEKARGLGDFRIQVKSVGAAGATTDNIKVFVAVW